MKLKNLAIIKSMRWVNLILLIGLIVLIFIYIMPVRIITNRIDPIYLFGLYLAIIVYFVCRGNQYYEYDTAGEVFNLKTKNYGPISFVSNFEKGIDVPMNKIKDYKLSKRLLSTELELFVKTKKNRSGITKVKFKLSYLHPKEYREIKEDLESIINKNNKLEQRRLVNEFSNKVAF